MSSGPLKVGKYEIIGKIAEGGMGAIYKAKHPTLKREIILKRLTLDKNESIAKRFTREAQLMMDFRNDNIVQVYDHFKEGKSYFIAMEFVDGQDISELIKQKRFIPSVMAMMIFIEICKALKYAHDRGVIHRDIKPENVLISRDGEVKLMDFGIAMSKEYEEGTRLTSHGMTLGTPSYMSPEQIFDTKNVDKRADIYSMGVMLYEMVTGRVPFPGDFTPESIAKIKKGEYIKARKINPLVLPLVQRVIKKAMHRDKDRRYKDLAYIIAIFSKQLKKYNSQVAINNSIKAFVYSDKSKAELVKPARKTMKNLSIKLTANFNSIVFYSIISSILITIGLLYGYMKGYHKEFILSEKYGAAKVRIKVQEKIKSSKDNFIDISVFRKVKRKYQEVENLDIDFSIHRDSPDSKYYFIESEKIYLEPDHYRIKVSYGNELYHKDLYLNPRVVQKKIKDTYEGRILSFDYKIIYRQPMKLYYKVMHDSKDITYRSELYIFAYGTWIKWSNFIRRANSDKVFLTGRTHKFMCKNEGYYTEYVWVYIKPNQTVLSMEFNLVPIPGILFLRANVSDLDILLNNSQQYFSGGKNRQLLTIPPSSLKYQKLVLAPGNYFMTVKKSSSVTKTLSIEIKPNKYTKVKIDYNQDSDRESIILKTY